MITIVKKYKITGITDNFNIDVLVPDCASLISKSYDKATEILTLVLQYCDADCIVNYDTIRVTLSYNDGFCFYDKEFKIEYPCTDFVITDDIAILPECDKICSLKFTAKTNQINVKYDWVFDPFVFKRIDDTSDDLILEYTKEGRKLNNVTSRIKLRVTNESDCRIDTFFDYLVCNPRLEFPVVDANCFDVIDGTITLRTGWFEPIVTSCREYDINLNKIIGLGVVKIVGDYKYIIEANGPGDKIRVTLKLEDNTLFTETEYKVFYKLDLCDDFIIDSVFVVNAVPCYSRPTSFRYIHDFNCEDCKPVASGNGLQGLIIDQNRCKPPVVDLDRYILSSSPIDWETFTFVATQPQVLVDSINMNSPYGTIRFNPLDHKISYTFTGGLNTVDLVTYSVEDVNGERVIGELRFNGPKCEDDPIQANITVCVKPNTISEDIILANSDAVVSIVQFPVNTTINLSNNKLTILSLTDFVGTDLITYTVTNPGSQESIEYTISVIVQDSIKNDTSICINPTTKVATLNLTPYNTVQDDQELRWSFNGFTNDVNNIPGIASAPLSINGGAVKIYDVLEYISLNNTATVEFTIPGIYYFKTEKQNDCSADNEVLVEIVNPISLPLAVEKNVCNSTGSVNLFNLVGSTIDTTGTWTSIGANVLSSLSGSTINTVLEEPGQYLIRYTIPNVGLYEDSACTSQMLMTLTIDAVADELMPKCLTLCSLGPDPVVVPDCQTTQQPTIILTNPELCTLDMYTALGLNKSRDRIRIVEIPITPIILDINGILTTFRVNDYLPLSMSDWAYYKAPLGIYKFEGVYGGSCENTVPIEITVSGAGCDVEDVDLRYCNLSPAINLLTELSTPSCAVSGITQISGTDNTSYNPATGVFNPVQPGMWVFDYSNTIDTDYSDCEICSNNARIIIVVAPLPGPGQAIPGAICNNDVCPIDVYPEFFIPNQSILGTFRYDGYKSTYMALPAICTDSLTLTNGTLDNVDITVDGPITYSPGDIVLPSLTLETNTTPGYYYFTNTVIDANGCECSSQTVVEVVEALDAGTGTTITMCELDPGSNTLFDHLTLPDAGGTWSVYSFTPATIGETYDIALIEDGPGFWQNADQASFNTTSQPVGVYVFRYVNTTQPTIFPYYMDCVECSGGVAEITLINSNSLVAGDGSSQSMCP